MNADLYFDMLSRSHHNAPLTLATPPPLDFMHKDSAPGPVYLRQQRTVEVIELVEVPAPPPRLPTSSIASSSAASSSSYSDSWQSAESDSEEGESSCSSYCSSDEEEMQERKIMFYDDTYGTRLSRVLVWRENFAKAMGVSLEDSPLLLKRKMEYEDVFDEDESSSHSSKRSRSNPPEQPMSHRRLSAHSCSACDECFTTRQSLQQHGQESCPNEACRVAVEYGLES